MGLENLPFGGLIKTIISKERHKDKLISEGGLVNAPPYVVEEVRKEEEQLDKMYEELSRREQEYKK